MTKSKIVTIAKTGENTWKDKVLTKHFVQFENGENGTLTTGFTEDPVPVVGDELEYTIEDKGFGAEIKLPRKAGSGGGGFGGAKKWTPSQIAQQDAIKLTQSYIQAGGDLKYWKQFFLEAKEFMVQQIELENAPKPTVIANAPNQPAPTLVDELSKNDLPF